MAWYAYGDTCYGYAAATSKYLLFYFIIITGIVMWPNRRRLGILRGCVI